MNRQPEGPAPRIFIDAPVSQDALMSLDAAASRHVAGALRLRTGASVTLFNGSGGEYRATIEAVDRKSVTVRILDFVQAERESPLSVALGLAISRGDRMDYAVQKATELGVTEIYPLITERTEVRLQGERKRKKRTHWAQIAVSACEQCGRNRLPVIHDLQSLDGWLASVRGDCKLVLHPDSDRGLDVMPPPASVSLLIGPEGGLSPAELNAAQAAGFRPMRLGPRVMRTETAPVAALAVLQFRWGDMQ
jgi:16S rRNA (uracil1498-N3)-methyltransferase